MNKVLRGSVVLGLALTLLACSDSLDKQIIGKWNYNFEVDIEDKDSSTPPKMKLDCNDEIYPNKSLSHKCKFIVAADSKDASENPLKMEIRGELNASGEWSISEKTVYDKTVDAKIEITEFVVNGNKITEQAALSEIKTSMENQFVKGETTKMKTISIDKNKWSYEMEVENKPVAVTATRS